MNESAYADGERDGRLEAFQANTTRSIDKLGDRVGALESRFASRPPWGVVYAFTIMQAVIGVLLTALVYVVTTR